MLYTTQCVHTIHNNKWESEWEWEKETSFILYEKVNENANWLLYKLKFGRRFFVITVILII